MCVFCFITLIIGTKFKVKILFRLQMKGSYLEFDRDCRNKQVILKILGIFFKKIGKTKFHKY